MVISDGERLGKYKKVQNRTRTGKRKRTGEMKEKRVQEIETQRGQIEMIDIENSHGRGRMNSGYGNEEIRWCISCGIFQILNL